MTAEQTGWSSGRAGWTADQRFCHMTQPARLRGMPNAPALGDVLDEDPPLPADMYQAMHGPGRENPQRAPRARRTPNENPVE